MRILIRQPEWRLIRSDGDRAPRPLIVRAIVPLTQLAVIGCLFTAFKTSFETSTVAALQ